MRALELDPATQIPLLIEAHGYWVFTAFIRKRR